MHHNSFLQTAIFILRGKFCWVLDFFNINFVDMELSEFKCLCAYVFLHVFFYSVSAIQLAVSKYGIR